MSQQLFIDNRDGFGPRDFTPFLLDREQFIQHPKNEPQLFGFTIIKVDDKPEWVVPQRGAYVRFFDDQWESRVSAVEDGLLFTGYITEDPDPQLVGTKSGVNVCQYHISCTSDEFLANKKRLPQQTYINQTRGFIIKDLLLTMFSGASPFPFDMSGIHDGGTERLYQVDTSKTWSEVLADFANADGFSYWLLDGYIFYGPEAPVTTYNDPLYRLTIDQYDPRYSPVSLQISRVARDIVNDITVLGEDEPADVVTEHFVSDGYQGAHNLAFVPFGLEESTIVSDDLTSSIDTGVWEEFDTGADYIQPFDGSLNIVGGPGVPATSSTPRTVALLLRRPIELSGVVEFRDGEVFFPPTPTGTGWIGGVYTDTSLADNTLWMGWYLDCGAKTFTAYGPSGAIGNAYPFITTRHYILRKTIKVDTFSVLAQSYKQLSTGAQTAASSFNPGLPRVDMSWKIDEINNDDPTNLVTTTTVIASTSYYLPSIPDYALYAPVVPNNCHYVTNFCLVSKPQQALLKVNDRPTKLGSFLDGGRAILQDDNGLGKLAWYAVPSGSGSISYKNLVQGDGATAYWRLGELTGSTSAVDSSGGNHTGTISNCVLQAFGALQSDDDYAYTFNGTSSYVNGTAFLLTSQYAGSVEFWFRTTSTIFQTIFSTENVTTGDGESFSTGSGQIGVGNSVGGGMASSRIGMADGRWHHCVATWDTSSVLRLYLDGVLDTTVLLGRLPLLQPWYIGRSVYQETAHPGTNSLFHGDIDEVAIYRDVTLSAAQVLKHYSTALSTSASVVTVPAVGSTISLTYNRKRSARARLISTESIDYERYRYRDDGVRQKIIRAGDVHPTPLTSEECLAMAKATLYDSSRQRYEGKYTFTAVANTPTDLRFWPRPGDLIDVSLDLPDGDVIDDQVNVQSVDANFLGNGAYDITLGFGPINRFDLVIRDLILKRKTSLDDPVIADQDAEVLETLDVGYQYPADLLDVSVDTITATNFTVRASTFGVPAEVVNYEVREDDTGWGANNYVARFNATSHVFTRPKRDLVYYIRPYNAGGKYAKRSAVVRVACPVANTYIVTGVGGDITAARIRVKIPIPRDPDYAGVIVTQGTAGAELYRGNGDQNITVAAGVEVLLTVGFVTVDIPNRTAATSYQVTVNTYNLLNLPGTAQTLTINTAADGAWTSPTFTSLDYTGSGSMTWGVTSPNVTTFGFTKVTSTMTVSFKLANTTITGTPSNTLRIKVPSTATAIKDMTSPCVVIDNGTRVAGTVSVDSLGTLLKIQRLDLGNFSLSAGTTGAEGAITFEYV